MTTEHHEHPEHHEHHKQHEVHEHATASAAAEAPRRGEGGFSLDNKWAAAAVVFAFLFVASFALLISNWGGGSQTTGNATVVAPVNNNTAVSESAVKEKIANFLDKNFLSQNGFRAEVGKIEPYDAYLNTVEVNIMQGNTTVQTVPIYATKNGESVILSGQIFKTNETVDTGAGDTENTAQPQTPAQAAAKADRPKIELFVMSYCPYGLQMMKAYAPIIELLGDEADVELHFVNYAMHGKKELDANSYLYCVQKEQQPKFAKYMRCFVETGDYTVCLATAGVDEKAANACVAALDKQYNITGLYNDQSTWASGQFPRYPVEDALNKKYGVQGSPTLVVNGQEASADRAAESVKQVVCGAFNTAPPDCNTTLSTASEAPGVGAVGSAPAAGTAANAAGCGT